MILIWIEKLKNGKYRAVERYTDILTGKEKKISVTMEKNTAPTRKAAEAALIGKIMQRNSVAPDSKDMTLAELADVYEKHQKRVVKASTWKRNHFALRTILRILGENTLISKLSAGYVMGRMLDTGKAPGTINEHLKRFKAMLRWGYKQDYVENVSWLDKLDPLKDEEKKAKLSEKYLEGEELKVLLDGMHIERWADLTRFLALSGLRLGEAMALELKDIDLKERWIHVTKTYDANNDIVTSTKTESSCRDVYIQDELLPVCRKVKGAAAADRMVGGNDRIFFNRRYDPFTYTKYLRENTEQILGRRLTPHALRHTHVALLAENGIPLETISRRLGHKDSTITRDVYFHVTRKLQEKENAMIQNIRIL